MQGKHPAIPDEALPPGRAAAILGVHADTIKRWEKAGRIASFRTPTGHRRYWRSEVEALATQGAEASA